MANVVAVRFTAGVLNGVPSIMMGIVVCEILVWAAITNLREENTT